MNRTDKGLVLNNVIIPEGTEIVEKNSISYEILSDSIRRYSAQLLSMRSVVSYPFRGRVIHAMVDSELNLYIWENSR